MIDDRDARPAHGERGPSPLATRRSRRGSRQARRRTTPLARARREHHLRDVLSRRARSITLGQGAARAARASAVITTTSRQGEGRRVRGDAALREVRRAHGLDCRRRDASHELIEATTDPYPQDEQSATAKSTTTTSSGSTSSVAARRATCARRYRTRSSSRRTRQRTCSARGRTPSRQAGHDPCQPSAAVCRTSTRCPC